MVVIEIKTGKEVKVKNTAHANNMVERFPKSYKLKEKPVKPPKKRDEKKD